MNRVNLIAVAAAGLIAGSALAATSSAPASKTIIVKKKAVPAKKLISKSAPKVNAASLSKPASSALASKSADTLTVSSSSATSSAVASTAVAAPGSAGTTTKAIGDVAKKPSFKDKFKLAIAFEYYGSALSDPFSGYQPDIEGEFSQSNATNVVDTHLTVGYKLSPNLTLSLNPYFTSSAGSKYETGDGAKGTFMQPTASYLKLGIGKIYSKGRFTWNGDLRYYPGITDDLQAKGVTHYFRTGQNFMLALSPKLTLAAYNTIRYYVMDGDILDAKAAKNPGANLPPELRVTMSPALEYQATDALNFSVSYNMDVNKPYRSSHIQNVGGTGAQYLEAGVVWGISPKVEFNPYLDMYTKHMDPNAMQIGANLSFSIL